MSDNVYRPGVQHPEEWRADLNPDAIDGPNFGAPGEHPEKDLLRAYDVKEIQPALRDMNDDDLRSMYRFIRSLGAKGERMPAPLAPNANVGTPYIQFTPQNLPAVSQVAPAKPGGRG